MPAVLCAKLGEVDTVANRGKYTVSVIGCEEQGVLCAVAFAEAGYKVVCADADQSLVRRLARGKTPFVERDVEVKVKGFVRSGQLSVTSEVKAAISQGDVVVVAVTAGVDAKKNPDYAVVQGVCKQVGSALREGALVVYCGVAGFGFTASVVREVLENASGFKAGVGFGLAYCPVQVSGGKVAEFGSEELLVAADDRASLDATAGFLGTVAKRGVRQFLGVKVAELAALFAVARRDVGVALANELAVLCESAGVDFFEVCGLLGAGVDGGFEPSIAAEDGDEAYLLLESAENLGVKLRVSALARQVNEDIVRHVVGLMQGTLRSCGKTLRRARVAVLGVVGERSMAWSLVELLEAKGAKVSVYDPVLVRNELSEVSRMFRRSLREAVENTDCVVVLGGVEQFARLSLRSLRAVVRMPAAVVDLAGRLDAQKVEKEGFVYRGLGRGVEKR